MTSLSLSKKNESQVVWNRWAKIPLFLFISSQQSAMPKLCEALLMNQSDTDLIGSYRETEWEMRTFILLRQRSGFGHRPLHVWIMVDQVALGQSSVRTLLFCPVSIIPAMLHTHSLHLYDSHPVVFITK